MPSPFFKPHLQRVVAAGSYEQREAAKASGELGEGTQKVDSRNRVVVIDRSRGNENLLGSLEEILERIRHQVGQTRRSKLFTIRTVDEIAVLGRVVPRQMRAAVPHVIHFQHGIAPLVLDAGVPLVNFARSESVASVIVVAVSPQA